MRDIKCPKYEECLSEAAKLNIDFNCKKCKKMRQDPSSPVEVEIQSNPIMFSRGGRSKCANECVRCQWRNSCRNAKPKCYESINKKEGGE